MSDLHYPFGWDPLLALRTSIFVPHFTRNLIKHDYRGGLLEGGSFSGRVRVAAYDSFISLLLDGYSELAGHQVRPQTGGLIVRLNRLVAAIDDEYEARLADHRSLDFADVLGASQVQAKLVQFGDFLKPYPERRAIRNFLYERVEQNYHTYVSLSASDASKQDSDWHFQTALLDSGGLSECLAHVIGLFHGQPVAEEVAGQFFVFGMMGKLADDVIDFWDDLAANRANLLLGMLHSHPAEQKKVEEWAPSIPGTAIRHGLRWWRRTCPESYADAADLVRDHRARLTSPKILLACDLVLLPAWYGRIVTSSPTIGLHR